MIVRVHTTTNYNAAGEIVSVIVFRVPVEDKMTPTDACDPCPDCNCGRLKRTAAAEVGERDLTPQEQQLMHGALRASSESAAEVVPVRLMSWMADRGYATGHGDTLDDVLDELRGQIIERCAQVADKFSDDDSIKDSKDVAGAIAAAIRALKDKKP